MMGWAFCGTDKYNREIGYSVKAICDDPNCDKIIQRGLSNVCGGWHGDTEKGCGRYFCKDHLFLFWDDNGDSWYCCFECYSLLEKKENYI